MLLLLLRGSGPGVPIVLGPFIVEALGVYQGGAVQAHTFQGGFAANGDKLAAGVSQGGAVVAKGLGDG